MTTRIALLFAAFAVGCGGGDSATAPSRVALTVVAVAPALGPASGGTAVTISGTGFRAGTTVMFGANAATDVRVKSSTLLVAVAPSSQVAGGVDVAVVGADGQRARLTSGYAYSDDSCVGDCWDY